MAYSEPVLLDDRVVAALEALVPLAPLHQPHALAAIRAVATIAPNVAQVACFDTAFHRGQPPLAQLFALHSPGRARVDRKHPCPGRE
jgi:acetate kinase